MRKARSTASAAPHQTSHFGDTVLKGIPRAVSFATCECVYTSARERKSREVQLEAWQPRTRIPGPNAGTGSEFSDVRRATPNHSAKQTSPAKRTTNKLHSCDISRRTLRLPLTRGGSLCPLEPQMLSTPSSCLHKSSRQALMICPCMAHPFPTQHRAAPPRTSSMSDGQENGVTA